MASVIRLSKTLAHLNSLVTCLLKTSAHSNGLVIRSLKNISLFKQLGLFSIKRLVLSVWKVQDWIVLHYLSHRSVLCKCHKSMLYQNQKWNHAWNNYVYHIKFTVKRNDKGNNLATCKAARKKLQLCFCVIKWQ